MGRYRNRLEIIANILFVVRDGAGKTRIMYQANLSHALLSRYLIEVLDAGLVSFENERHYRLTRRGQNFLDRFSEYSKLCDQLKQQSNDVNNEKKVLENMIDGNLDRHSNERRRNQKVT